MNKFILKLRVRSCEKRSRPVRTIKNAEGQAEVVESENLGWFLTLDPIGLSICLGPSEMENPGFSAGDSVELVIRKARGKAPAEN